MPDVLSTGFSLLGVVIVQLQCNSIRAMALSRAAVFEEWWNLAPLTGISTLRRKETLEAGRRRHLYANCRCVTSVDCG